MLVEYKMPGDVYAAVRQKGEDSAYRRNFPKLLRLFCDEVNITLSDLARICAVDRRTVSRWTAGEQMPVGEILYDMVVYAKNNGGIQYLIPDLEYLEQLDSDTSEPQRSIKKQVEKEPREKPAWQW